MTFELSPEYEAFRKVVREFAESEIAPHAARWDKEHHFPTDVVTKMGELGLMGLPFDEADGGTGGEQAARAAGVGNLASRRRVPHGLPQLL